MTTEAAAMRSGARSFVSRDVVLWALFFAVDTMTQLAFKGGGNQLEGIEFGRFWLRTAFSSPVVWLAIAGYVTMFLLWMLILQRSELNRAFTLTGLAYVFVPLGAWALFGEEISWVRAAGIALIISGVTLIGGEEEQAAHEQMRADSGQRIYGPMT